MLLLNERTPSKKEKTTTKTQTIRKSAAFLGVPVHPSTTTRSLRRPYNEMSKQYTPSHNSERRPQTFHSSSLKSHERSATHRH